MGSIWDMVNVHQSHGCPWFKIHIPWVFMGFSRFEPLISMDFYGLMCFNENRIMLANQNDMRTNHNGMLTNHQWEYGGIVMQLWPHISWQYHGINQPSMEFSMGLKVFFFPRVFLNHQPLLGCYTSMLTLPGRFAGTGADGKSDGSCWSCWTCIKLPPENSSWKERTPEVARVSMPSSGAKLYWNSEFCLPNMSNMDSKLWGKQLKIDSNCVFLRV